MDSITEGVIAKIRERAATGERKYGVTMDRNDLTVEQWLNHLQQELMDATVYTEKLIRLNGVCKWGSVNTACGEPHLGVHMESSRFQFCPFCGRKIEVVR